MKRYILSLAVLAFSVSTYAQSDCRAYLPADVGTTWEMTSYNKKDKVQGSVSYTLVDKVVSAGETVFVVQSDSFDKKGKELFSNTFEATCSDGRFDFGMNMQLDGAALSQYQDMNLEIDASDFIIPPMDTPNGTELDDASMTVGLGGAGPISLNMTINITDRVVEAREEIETPAGTFDTLLLNQTINTKMVLNVQSSTKEWYAEDVGVVRTETYNKKGKLQGYSVLTAFN